MSTAAEPQPQQQPQPERPAPQQKPEPRPRIPEIPADWVRKGDLPDEPPKEL